MSINKKHQIEIEYKGKLRTESVHLGSGHRIITDAPIDNYGKGQAFSPTDLVVSALGSCILTIIGIVATRNQVSIDGSRCNILKEMTVNPRKISKIVINIYIQNLESSVIKKKIEHAAKSCPVYNSLDSNIHKKIIFNYY